MRIAIATTCLVLVLVPALAGDDPWTGRSRNDVVATLGEPDKVKRGRDGRETLIYRFYRLREGAVPGPRMSPVTLAGVGVVYRIVPSDLDDVDYEPTTIDSDGRPVAGGARSSEGGSTSYDWESGTLDRDWDPDDIVDVAGKVKLTLTLDADGRAVAWKVSPRGALQARPPK